jgi:hypothetical protein
MVKKFLKAAIILSMSLVFMGASIGSGEKTADAVISAATCYISSIQVITDGTNDAKVILYDNASAASGTVICELTVSGSANFGGRYWNPRRLCINGIFADVTGTGASYIIDYSN